MGSSSRPVRHARRLVAAPEDAWTADTLAGLADTGTTLADGTELFVGLIAFAAEGQAFALPPDDGDPPNSRSWLENLNMQMSLLACLPASNPTAARRSSSASTQLAPDAAFPTWSGGSRASSTSAARKWRFYSTRAGSSRRALSTSHR